MTDNRVLSRSLALAALVCLLALAWLPSVAPVSTAEVVRARMAGR
jgi:hypothetical protein